MRTARPARYVMATAALGILVGGCDLSSADVGEEERPRAVSPDLPVGILSGVTSGGTQVRIALEPDPPLAGEIRVSVELDPPPEDGEAVTVDLVAPEMPAHGVTRHTVGRTEDPGRFAVEIPVPMEGLWELYVNLDVGLDATSFRFRVEENAQDPRGSANGGGAPGHGGDDTHGPH